MREELKQKINERVEYLISQKDEVIKIADEAYDNGIDNIFFAGSGGSYTTLKAFAYFFKKYSTIPAYSESAAEARLGNYKQLNNRSLVVIMAKTGTMVESVKLSEYCRTNGIPSVGFVIYDHTPVADNVKYKVLIDEMDSPARYLTFYLFLFRLMYRNGDLKDFDEFVEQLSHIGDVLNAEIDVYDHVAYEFAEKYHKEPFQLYLYSGPNEGEVLKYSADISEELFRIPTQLVHTSEFFHGCLEIADDDLCIVLCMGLDSSREMDERCLRFLEKYASAKLTVFDPAKVPMTAVKEEYRELFVPMMIMLFLTTMVNT